MLCLIQEISTELYNLQELQIYIYIQDMIWYEEPKTPGIYLQKIVHLFLHV